METFRKRLRRFGTPCLVFSLSTALAAGNVNTLAPAPLQTISPAGQLKPPVAEQYQQLWAQAVKNSKIETGPKLWNPAILNNGLAPGVVSALREQRDYLAAHGTVSPNQAPVNASARELVDDNSRKPRPSSGDPPCHQPIIRSVNGKTRGVVFTPTAADNIYRIEGCFFGDAPGIVQLEVHSAPHQPNAIPPIPMQLGSASPGTTWSERELNVHLDPELSGIADYPVMLVIYPAKHRRIELRGCRFVAARGIPQLLSMIPSAWVSLYPSGVGSRSIRQLEYVSPTQASDAVPKDASASAFVVRSDPRRFGIGKDSYDFSRLNPGWVVESVQLRTYSVSCPQAATSTQSLGGWQAEWTPRGVRVAFQESVCASLPPHFGFNMSQSQYAIRVWVVGPVGTLPLAVVR